VIATSAANRGPLRGPRLLWSPDPGPRALPGNGKTVSMSFDDLRSRVMLPAIGYAIREQNRYILDEPALNAVEITFDLADAPLRLARSVGDDRDFDYVSVHALKLSPASPEPPGRQYLEAIRAIAEENGCASISDHLGFTRDGHGGVEMGHFAPPPLTPEALDATSRHLDVLQHYFR